MKTKIINPQTTKTFDTALIGTVFAAATEDYKFLYMKISSTTSLRLGAHIKYTFQPNTPILHVKELEAQL